MPHSSLQASAGEQGSKVPPGWMVQTFSFAEKIRNIIYGLFRHVASRRVDSRQLHEHDLGLGGTEIPQDLVVIIEHVLKVALACRSDAAGMSLSVVGAI